MNNIMKTPGMIVKTKTGLLGRTYSNKPGIGMKVAVYVYDMSKFNKGDTIDICDVIKQGLKEMPVLCDPYSLEIIGYID